MSDAWRVASITGFTRVPAGPSSVLLRVSARSPVRPDSDEVRPTLIVDSGPAADRFPAIPAPADHEGVLRAAYSVPESLADAATAFSLAFADGSAIVLPAPEPRAPAEVRHESVELRAARQRILEVHLQAAELSAELEALRDLAQLTGGTAIAGATASPGADAAATDLEGRVIELEALARDHEVRRLQAERARAQAAERLSELETWTSELERRLAATTTELAEARAAAGAASGAGPISAERLAQLQQDALAEAHAQAEQDLAEAAADARA